MWIFKRSLNNATRWFFLFLREKNDSAQAYSSVCYANLEFWLSLGPGMLLSYPPPPTHPRRVWKIVLRARPRRPYFHYFCTLQHKWAPKLAPNFICYANLEIWPLWGHSGGHTMSTIEKPSTNICFFHYSTSLTITRQQFHRSVLRKVESPFFPQGFPNFKNHDVYAVLEQH